jgi:hypothetical protein
MINKNVINFGAVIIALFSLGVLAVAADNPFRKSLDITKNYLPKAFVAMWQSEHLIWRAQLFKAACSQNTQPVNMPLVQAFH